MSVFEWVRSRVGGWGLKDWWKVSSRLGQAGSYFWVRSLMWKKTEEIANSVCQNFHHFDWLHALSNAVNFSSKDWWSEDLTSQHLPWIFTHGPDKTNNTQYCLHANCANKCIKTELNRHFLKISSFSFNDLSVRLRSVGTCNCRFRVFCVFIYVRFGRCERIQPWNDEEGIDRKVLGKRC